MGHQHGTIIPTFSNNLSKFETNLPYNDQGIGQTKREKGDNHLINNKEA